MDPIRHVVLLMLENRSFDQMLGCMQALHPSLDGIATPPRSQDDGRGRAYAQTPTTTVQMLLDPKHEHANALRQITGDNGGFLTDYFLSYGEKLARPSCGEVLGYFPRGFLPGIHPLAEEFTVCDRWFSSLPGPTWPNRCFALSGTSRGRVLMPEGVQQLGMLFSQTQDTIFDRLNERGLPWRVYFYDFPVSLVLARQREPQNLACHRHIDELFEDARKSADDFPAFAVVEPKYFGVDQNDDHPPHNVMKAQKLIADVYNAIRSNPALWESTLLVVVYDEHGGFYDHVPPPAAVPPDEHHEEYAFDRLGVRVPAVLVSPWLDRRVEHTVFDHTSLLRYMVEKWQLAPLGARTASANSIACAFTGLAAPRADGPAFIRVPAALLVPPDAELEQRQAGAHQQALHLLADLLAAPAGAAGEIALIVAEAARAYDQALPRAEAALGDWLIRAGRALREPLEKKQRARTEKTERAIDSLIPHARAPRR